MDWTAFRGVLCAGKQLACQSLPDESNSQSIVTWRNSQAGTTNERCCCVSNSNHEQSATTKTVSKNSTRVHIPGGSGASSPPTPPPPLDEYAEAPPLEEMACDACAVVAGAAGLSQVVVLVAWFS